VHRDELGSAAALFPDPLAAVPDAVCHLDRSWRFTYLNVAAASLAHREPAQLIGRPVQEAFPRMRGTLLEQRLREGLADGRPRTFEFHDEPRDRWYEVRAFPDDTGMAVVLRDDPTASRPEAADAAERQRLARVLEAVPLAAVVLADDGRILAANGLWRRDHRDLGGPGEDYLAVVTNGLDPADRGAVEEGIRALLSGDDAAGPTFDHACRHADGGAGRLRIRAARVDDPPRVVVTHTELGTAPRPAWHSHRDDLTDLPNRAAMLQLIDAALAEAAEGGPGTAVLFLDLDGFKTVNDSLGHEVGDTLLREAAGRLVEQVRPGDAVGRLGGDQFLVLARGCDSAEAAALAFRLQTTFALPFPAEGLSVPLSASIGVAVGRAGERDAHRLLSDADAAMYAAKAAGRDRVHLFSPGLREAAKWRLEVATRLRDGAVDQLVVHYQPVVRLDTGEVEGVEALLRWQHPERGLLLPDAFLAVAEETGQLIPITRWLLRVTTRQAARWAAQGLRLRMAVNISARHFSAETLVRDVRVALRDSGLPPEQLLLELTETSVAEDPNRAEEQLALLRRLGVRVAIDDFGTGWSSLAQLLALPIGTLKIDRSLLTATQRVAAGDSGAVLAAIVALTRTLGIRSVAEGVETTEHLRLVREAGCDLAQGWLLAQPMPAAEVPGWVGRLHASGGDLTSLPVPNTVVPGTAAPGTAAPGAAVPGPVVRGPAA
jgi:diguanylate cyclase (GGDEF)-like protein